MSHVRKAPQSVALSQLGARLRELREQAELTGSEAARQAKTDPGTISRVENGLRGLAPKTAERLLDCYDVHDQAVRDEVLELAKVGAARRRRPSWWKKHQEVLSPTQFDGYLALESSACALRNYEPLVVPGLLQTPEYAHEVIASMRPDLRPTQIKQLADIRMARQRKVFIRGAIDFSALIDETALLRPVGEGAVMGGQLEHLVAAAENSRTSIRLLPLSSGLHPGLAGPFMVMGFPEATRDIVWVETMNRSVYFEEEADVERYTEVFADLWERALTPGDTRVRLREMCKEQQQ